MSTWRRKVIERWPDLRNDVQESEYSLYYAFAQLLNEKLGPAHESQNDDELRKIYGFAEWCLRQRSKTLWNPAAVSFYEDLFRGSRWQHRERIVEWLSPYVLRMVLDLVLYTNEEHAAEIKRLIDTRLRERYSELIT